MVIYLFYFWDIIQIVNYVLSSILKCIPPGVPWPDGHGGPHPLRAQPAAHHRPHPGRVRVPGAGVQRPDLHLHLPAHEGAVEPGGGATGGVLHRHRARLHLALRRRILRQRGHRHLRPAVHLLPLGTPDTCCTRQLSWPSVTQLDC